LYFTVIKGALAMTWKLVITVPGAITTPLPWLPDKVLLVSFLSVDLMTTTDGDTFLKTSDGDIDHDISGNPKTKRTKQRKETNLLLLFIIPQFRIIPPLRA